MAWATAIKGIMLLRLTLHWTTQPWCLVIYFGCLSALLLKGGRPAFPFRVATTEVTPTRPPSMFKSFASRGQTGRGLRDSDSKVTF